MLVYCKVTQCLKQSVRACKSHDFAEVNRSGLGQISALTLSFGLLKFLICMAKGKLKEHCHSSINLKRT